MKQSETLEQAIGRAMEPTPRPDAARLEEVLLRLQLPVGRQASKPWRTVWPWLMLVTTLAAAAAGHWYYRHSTGSVEASTVPQVLAGEKPTSPHTVPNSAPGPTGNAAHEQPAPPPPAGNSEQRNVDIIYRH